MENKTVYSATLTASQESQKKAVQRTGVLYIGFDCGCGHKSWDISALAA